MVAGGRKKEITLCHALKASEGGKRRRGEGELRMARRRNCRRRRIDASINCSMAINRNDSAAEMKARWEADASSSGKALNRDGIKKGRAVILFPSKKTAGAFLEAKADAPLERELGFPPRLARQIPSRQASQTSVPRERSGQLLLES